MVRGRTVPSARDPSGKPVPDKLVGIDRNMGQIVLSNGAFHHLPELDALYDTLVYLQRKMARQQPKSKR